MRIKLINLEIDYYFNAMYRSMGVNEMIGRQEEIS